VKQSPDVSAAPTAFFPPVRIPIGTVGACGATLLAAFDHLLAQPHPGPILGGDHPVTLELGPGKDEQPAQVVLVEISDRVEQIAVKGHLRPLRAVRRA
jgi:hypothetical protein